MKLEMKYTYKCYSILYKNIVVSNDTVMVNSSAGSEIKLILKLILIYYIRVNYYNRNFFNLLLKIYAQFL